MTALSIAGLVLAAYVLVGLALFALVMYNEDRSYRQLTAFIGSELLSVPPFGMSRERFAFWAFAPALVFGWPVIVVVETIGWVKRRPVLMKRVRSGQKVLRALPNLLLWPMLALSLLLGQYQANQARRQTQVQLLSTRQELQAAHQIIRILHTHDSLLIQQNKLLAESW